jgi:outer membrane protein
MFGPNSHKEMQMKKFLLTIAAASLAIPVLAQSAAPARFAVIDVQKVLNTSTAGKAAQERLKKLNDDKAARAQKMQEDITALTNDLNSKKALLSEEKLADMQKQLNDKQVALQRFGQDAERDLGEARDKELAELEAKIKPVIDSIGKEMGLAAIFNKFESGLVYASDAIDITDTVVKRFNESTAAPAAQPAKK